MKSLRKKLLNPIIFIIFLIPTIIFAQYDNTQQGTTQATDRNPKFDQVAWDLSKDLQTRINLSQEQTEDVVDILVDYQQEIFDIRTGKTGIDLGMDNDADDRTDTDVDTDVDTDADNDTDVDVDVQTERDKTRVDDNDQMEKFAEADSDANDKIEDVLEDNQKSAWLSYKESWWKSVKDRVHSEDYTTPGVQQDKNPE